MSETNQFPRASIAAPVADILRRLPRMGTVMVNTRHGGATHERMGLVEDVVVTDESVLCRGACHDARIAPERISTVVVDRTGRMQDKVLPRLDFLGDGRAVVFSVIGLAGLEPFDAGLAGLVESGLHGPVEKGHRETPVLAEDDPGLPPLKAAAHNEEPVIIEIARPGFFQRWRGIVGSVKPAMGFINVMHADFHLHLRGGAVGGWQRETADGEALLEALGADGMPTGLRLRGSAAAFRAVQAR